MHAIRRRDFLQRVTAAGALTFVPVAAARQVTEKAADMNESTAQAGMTTFRGASAGGTSVERFTRGIAVLKKIGGEGYDIPVNRLAQVAPDLARFTVEFAYGDVLSRPGLDLRLRQIATVASLMAQGSVQPQLKYHMTGFLNAGGEPAELVELLFVSIAILGFPASINAVAIVREIFQARKLAFEPIPPVSDDGTARYQRGLRALDDLTGNAAKYVQALSSTSPELARWSVEFVYGETLVREGFEAKVRQLAIVSMLATAGNRSEQLRFHIEGGLRAGLSQTEITEALMQLAVYAGFPNALNAFAVANSVFSGHEQKPAASSSAGAAAPASEDRATRRDRGLATLAKTSAHAGEAVVKSFNDLAPDIGGAIVEHSYGDIFSRPGLDAKTRELAACSALAAVGSKAMETPLRVHMKAALTAGATEAEIVETLLNLLPYRGYPAVEESMRVAGEEFANHNRQRGVP
jgi:4-carboxymuconolactone decarboxylase